MKDKLLSAVAISAIAAVISCNGPAIADPNGQKNNGHNETSQASGRDATPIKRLVVIFNENRSFDHYFATYPTATNPSGEPMFTAARNTPAVNNRSANPGLLPNYPNFTNTA